MSPACNGSPALQRFERCNALEIRNGMFDFYPGLPHMHAHHVPRETRVKFEMVNLEVLSRRRRAVLRLSHSRVSEQSKSLGC